MPDVTFPRMRIDPPVPAKARQAIRRTVNRRCDRRLDFTFRGAGSIVDLEYQVIGHSYFSSAVLLLNEIERLGHRVTDNTPVDAGFGRDPLTSHFVVTAAKAIEPATDSLFPQPCADEGVWREHCSVLLPTIADWIYRTATGDTSDAYVALTQSIKGLRLSPAMSSALALFLTPTENSSSADDDEDDDGYDDES